MDLLNTDVVLCNRSSFIAASVLILSIFACYNAHIMRHEYTSDSLYMMMEMGEKAFWIDYYLYETLCFGSFPALLIVVANVLYRKFGGSNGNQSVIIKVLKYLGVLCGVFVLVIGWLVFAIVAMPLHVMITVMVIALILYLLLECVFPLLV